MCLCDRPECSYGCGECMCGAWRGGEYMYVCGVAVCMCDCGGGVECMYGCEWGVGVGVGVGFIFTR